MKAKNSDLLLSCEIEQDTQYSAASVPFRDNSRSREAAAGPRETCRFWDAVLAEPIHCERVKDGRHHPPSGNPKRWVSGNPTTATQDLDEPHRVIE
jgi:hypothetical protein